MVSRRKMQDKSIWKRLGFELKILDLLIEKVQTDGDYQAVMGKVKMRKLESASRYVGALRADAESRMDREHIHEDFIYMGADFDSQRQISELVSDFRQRIKKESGFGLRTINAAELYKMSDVELAELSMKEGD